MVIVHDYSEGKNQLPSSYNSISGSGGDDNGIDEDRAYVVGIWVAAIVAAIVIVLFVLFAVGRSQQKETAESTQTQEEQILGEKKKTEEPKTAMKEQTTTEDVKDLERPLSEDEIIAKAEEIPGSQIHTVVSGESLYTIGEKYEIDWHEIADLTNLSPPYNLHAGQKLIIPSKGGNE